MENQHRASRIQQARCVAVSKYMDGFANRRLYAIVERCRHTRRSPESAMTTILRSPAISTETRKLSSRHARAAPASAPAAQPQPQQAAVPNLDALLAQARESVLAQFKQEAETARELGRQRGLQEGRAAGT